MIGMRSDLVIVVIAHNEGEIADYTMKSLFVAVKSLKEEGITYEFLINIDNGSQETINYFKKYRNDRGIKINYTNYGDPGLARNYAARIARGKYIAMIDADDAVSENWFAEAISMLEKEDDLVLAHPEYEMRYTEQSLVSIDKRVDLKNNWEDQLALLLGNRWCSVVVGKKEIFAKNKYSQSVNGFGYEDYFFNCEVVFSGVRNRVIKNTSAFCLVKRRSVTSDTHRKSLVLPYCELFSFDDLRRRMDKYGLPVYDSDLKIEKVPKQIAQQAKDYYMINHSFVAAMKQLGAVELRVDGVYECIEIGVKFCRMIDGLKLKYLSGRMVIINNLVDYAESRGESWDIIVAMRHCDNVPKDNLIDFWSVFGAYPEWVKDELMTRILVQLEIKEIVLPPNDVFMGQWVEKHQAYIRGNSIMVTRMI